MKQLLEFIPLIVFFIVFKMIDIYAAIWALIICCLLQLTINWVLYKKIEKAQLITFIITVIFGGLSIFFRNDTFIKWKVTIIYLIFALILVGSDYLKKPILKTMLAKEITMPESIWYRVNRMWALFFIMMAGLNYYIATHYSTAIWVDFKVFWAFGLMLLCTIATGIYIYKHGIETEPKESSETTQEQEKKGSIDE